MIDKRLPPAYKFSFSSIGKQRESPRGIMILSVEPLPPIMAKRNENE